MSFKVAFGGFLMQLVLIMTYFYLVLSKTMSYPILGCWLIFSLIILFITSLIFSMDKKGLTFLLIGSIFLITTIVLYWMNLIFSFLKPVSSLVLLFITLFPKDADGERMVYFAPYSFIMMLLNFYWVLFLLGTL